jgi:hypothetical protein
MLEHHVTMLPRRLSLLLSCLLPCLLLWLPSVPGRAAEKERVEPRPVKNWIGWDMQIERGYLAEVYRRALWDLDDPVRMYEQAVTYDAPLDSLGLTAFRQLPPGERSRRRDLASSYLSKAQRFEVIIWDLVQYTKEDMVLIYPKGFMDSLARALGHLVNAVGLDPANPEAWYDLSYLAGTSGDTVRQEQALRAALEAIGSDPQGAYRLLKHRLFLDLAWLGRERGLPEEGLVPGGSQRGVQPDPWPAASRPGSIQGCLRPGRTGPLRQDLQAVLGDHPLGLCPELDPGHGLPGDRRVAPGALRPRPDSRSPQDPLRPPLLQ